MAGFFGALGSFGCFCLDCLDCFNCFGALGVFGLDFLDDDDLEMTLEDCEIDSSKGSCSSSIGRDGSGSELSCEVELTELEAGDDDCATDT